MTKGTLLRKAALEILLSQEKEEVIPELISDRIFDKYGLADRRDRAFVTLLSEGTVERKITLDHVIGRFSSVKPKKIRPVIRNILRLGVYQILFMDSVPESAAVNESVKLAGLSGLKPLSGFVNGVLREIARKGFDISSIEDPSVRYSMPEWIVGVLTEEFGRERADGIMASFLDKRPVFIRTNLLRSTREGLRERLSKEGIFVKAVPDNDIALEIADFGDIKKMAAFQEGLFSVQDLSSMEVGREISAILSNEVKGSFFIKDLCGAPGGKACHAAEAVGLYKARTFPEDGDSTLFWVRTGDISEKKTDKIRENIERLRLKNIDVRVFDARMNDGEGENADLIIADLPCSGLGVIGRKNDIKYRRKKEDIPVLRDLQREILKASVGSLKTEGFLIFSVCTINREETKEQRDWIEKSLGLDFIKDRLFIPGEDPGDGFYYAVFKKK